jgi:hypothetical protein
MRGRPALELTHSIADVNPPKNSSGFGLLRSLMVPVAPMPYDFLCSFGFDAIVFREPQHHLCIGFARRRSCYGNLHAALSAIAGFCSRNATVRMTDR